MSDNGASEAVELDGFHFARMLASAIHVARDGQHANPVDPAWLAEHAVDPQTGLKPLKRQNAEQLLNEPRKQLLAVEVERALAHLFWGGDSSIVYTAIAVGRGSEPPAGRSQLASTFPRQIDDLPIAAQQVGRDMWLEMCRLAGKL